MAGSIKSDAEGAFRDWSVPRQLAGEDPLGKAAESNLSRTLRPRLEDADKVGTSICPYCAVGCAYLTGIHRKMISQASEILKKWTG